MTTPQPTLSPTDTGAPENLAAHLAELAERRGWTGRPAFHQGQGSWTHAEVHDLAARAATVLAGHGVGPGDRVLLALPDSIAWVTAFLATARLGAVAVLVNPELTPPELEFMADDTEAALHELQQFRFHLGLLSGGHGSAVQGTHCSGNGGGDFLEGDAGGGDACCHAATLYAERGKRAGMRKTRNAEVLSVSPVRGRAE